MQARKHSAKTSKLTSAQRSACNPCGPMLVVCSLRCICTAELIGLLEHDSLLHLLITVKRVQNGPANWLA